MRSTGPIHPIFERNLFIIIIHHPGNYHQNRTMNFRDINRKTRTDTHRHNDADENNTCQKKFFGQGILPSLPCTKIDFEEWYHFHWRVFFCHFCVCMCVCHYMFSNK